MKHWRKLEAMATININIDRGGTFTDCIAFDSNSGQEYIVKLLSLDPQHYSDAPTEGIRRILELASNRLVPRNIPIPTDMISRIRMGTTVATNSLLERNGERVALLITKGFKNALRIGNQARPDIFDLSIKSLDVLYETILEVDERVTLADYTSSKLPLNNCKLYDNTPDYVQGKTGEWVHIIKRPDLKLLETQLIKLQESGIKSVAISLMHSFTFPDHEIQIGNLCNQLGFKYVSISSTITPMIKLIPRGNSAVVDAYLTPCLQKYIHSFYSGFDDGINNVRIEFMQSDGGLTPVSSFTGFRAILSGPAAGVVGYAKTSWEQNRAPVIGFDMGGTSTDVSRFDGRFSQVFETNTAGITIQAPQLDINTVAAGGGSRLFFRNGMFVVGPESCGANPGPTCYRNDGPLAITDANLLLGRLLPQFFPKIFGTFENQELDVEATRIKFSKLTETVNSYLISSKDSRPSMTLDQVAYGFIRVANESMCRPIRALTQSKGHDTRNHVLTSFGGAGAQHACAIAKNLGISTILIHKHCSILSAYGLSLADVIYEIQEPSCLIFSQENIPIIQERVKELNEKCRGELETQGFSEKNIQIEIMLNMRYDGTDTSLMILKPQNDWDFIPSFTIEFQNEFGFKLYDREIIIDDIRLRGIGKSFNSRNSITVYSEIETLTRKNVTYTKASLMENVYWETGRSKTPIFKMELMDVGDEIIGPALLIDSKSTIVIEPDCSALLTSEHVVITVGNSIKMNIGTELDPIQLSIFGHRFMSIAEQMGYTLQKTAISTNIKERLDFSCAIFGNDGGLVANAPHIPVHLGSMQEAVKWQIVNHGSEMNDGDVFLSNHPSAGGSHLPDITVITPVFKDNKISFFVASRGHHADIGGIQPGSMPPLSKELYQEGAAIKSLKLVERGTFNESEITRLLTVVPAQYEGCVGTRCLSDNISDLKAQVAANHRGITLVKSLINEYGLEVVQKYMKYIQQNAEMAVRDLLKQTSKKLGDLLSARDYMDDGSEICLSVKIDSDQGTAIFDFSGTGTEVYANWNAPRAVTYSAIIYCLRSLINLEIPLNQGALLPITIKIPENSLLNPSDTAAVVGGNVMTSQRLCDVILKAFNACAASQGCCNNLTFGKDCTKDQQDGFGYYETIGGGAGAGPSWTGASGVHTHMTNTRLTDPEILERRYPVILHEFNLRHGSGGIGLYNGGEGMIREFEFQEKLNVSILSERRSFRPFGMHGGTDGACGLNIYRKWNDVSKNYRDINLGGKNSIICYPNDRIRIMTPGGGAWGAKA